MVTPKSTPPRAGAKMTEAMAYGLRIAADGRLTSWAVGAGTLGSLKKRGLVADAGIVNGVRAYDITAAGRDRLSAHEARHAR